MRGEGWDGREGEGRKGGGEEDEARGESRGGGRRERERGARVRGEEASERGGGTRAKGREGENVGRGRRAGGGGVSFCFVSFCWSLFDCPLLLAAVGPASHVIHTKSDDDNCHFCPPIGPLFLPPPPPLQFPSLLLLVILANLPLPSFPPPPPPSFHMKIMPIKMVFFFFVVLLSLLSLFPSANASLPPASVSLNNSTTTTNGHDDDALLRSLPRELDIARVKEVVPVEASDFFDQLTSRDKQVLRDVLAKADTYESTGEVLKDLRNGSSTLYDKAVQMVASMRGIVMGLSAPARAFVDESVSQLRNGLGNGLSLSNLRAQAQQLVGRYRQLAPNTRDELRDAFPTVASVLDSSVIQTLASGLFDIQTNNGEDQVGNDGAGKSGGEGESGVVDEVGERAERRLVAHRSRAVAEAAAAAAEGGRQGTAQ